MIYDTTWRAATIARIEGCSIEEAKQLKEGRPITKPPKKAVKEDNHAES